LKEDYNFVGEELQQLHKQGKKFTILLMIKITNKEGVFVVGLWSKDFDGELNRTIVIV